MRSGFHTIITFENDDGWTLENHRNQQQKLFSLLVGCPVSFALKRIRVPQQNVIVIN